MRGAAICSGVQRSRCLQAPVIWRPDALPRLRGVATMLHRRLVHQWRAWPCWAVGGVPIVATGEQKHVGLISERTWSRWGWVGWRTRLHSFQREPRRLPFLSRTGEASVLFL
ncbi:uncharacterized protein K452DRAFT_72736 [Aplosporella prunicola CBS 121167]|uniref:Uncharacterized protein n=1 Tax=Aplosporella prunicola CBS 121167 TaxID=1176127 RepID=A0A6A6BW48_9PEZI|nr:uncharacterized protein K452DRAFT_72736 [Aplosporella prunicola CBS 121167]KAF2146921.1 hypothetical protein K452DRAFT_72736 [Aplosporella prunicola CBS 121167]